MKRAPELIPYSHDHQHVLAQSIRLKRAATGGDEAELALRSAEVIEFARGELADHMHEEEAALLPRAQAAGCLTEDDAARVAREHLDMRVLMSRLEQAPTDAELALDVAERLHDHVRWEERELFAHFQERGISAHLAAPSDVAANAALDVKTLAPLEEQGSRGVASTQLNATSVQLIEGRTLERANVDRDVALVVVDGTGTLDLNGTDYELARGVVVVMPAGSERRIEARTGGLTFTTVHRRRSASPALPELPE